MEEIRKAAVSDYEAVLDFYRSVVMRVEELSFNRIWKTGSYPTPEYIRGFIERGELYILTDGDDIIAATALNHSLPGYDDVVWSVQCDPDQVLIIHLLGVAPSHMGAGYGKMMTRFAIKLARETGMKAIRLDVLPYNIPAVRAYEREGFRYIITKSMDYGDAVGQEFLLYEYPVEN